MNNDFEFDALESARNYRKYIERLFSPHLKGCVVEVGAGIGQNTENFKKVSSIENYICVEPEFNYLESLKKRSTGCKIIHGTIENLPPTDNPNAIISVNVLEHIEKDLDELKKYKHRLQQKRGRLCLFVPARKELFSEMDRDFGHYRRYTLKDLNELLNLAGFEHVEIKYCNFIGYFTWMVKFKLLGKREFKKHEVEIFDRLIFPISSKMENYIRIPFGQSLVAICY
jgi:hypothetical protein